MGRKINSGLSSGVHGQISFENFELLNKLNEQRDFQKIVLNVEKWYKFKNYPHKLPMTGQIPNSSQIQKDENGNITRIRYYDEKGNAYKDVDYTDHGNPSKHKVPHTHIIIINDKIDRKEGV